MKWMIPLVWIALCAGWVAPVHADVLPPDVEKLRQAVARAETAAKAVEADLRRQRQSERKLDASLRTLARFQVQMSQVPDGFWLARAVLSDTPDLPGMMAAVMRVNAKALTHAQARGGRLARLYGRTLESRAELAALVASLTSARGRLQAEERAMMYQAGVDADRLADELEQALALRQENTALPPAEAVLPAARKGCVWPVTGRLAQGFQRGKGATAEGVVLQGAPFGTAKSPVVGTVLYAGPFRVFGGLVILKSHTGDDVLLGGLSAVSVQANDAVDMGQAIGTLAETGRLYWEVRRRGRVLNPLAAKTCALGAGSS